MERNPLKIADMTLGQISDACKEQQDCRKCPLRLDKRKMFGTVRGICVTDEFRETTTPDGRTAAMQPCEWRFFGKMDDSPEIAPEFRRLRDLTIRQIVTICRCKFYCRTCTITDFPNLFPGLCRIRIGTIAGSFLQIGFCHAPQNVGMGACHIITGEGYFGLIVRHKMILLLLLKKETLRREANPLLHSREKHF